ncbi:Aste57867_24049 [Aphanomyces stellatus]|uniref:Aste57867_24049 protein n=1 Tax=Aphanomyces stellatus TaxID=120398 RepID=A0A485LPG3_9STRA|nr:hypothetical protein As57867_023976 [Aphanomyces stellatus]VFU00692.1 Aste57867_24049 [Aphanomyces stellatus]
MVNLQLLPCCGLFGGFLSYLLSTDKSNSPPPSASYPPLMSHWLAFESPLVQPQIIDMRGGGHLEMVVMEVPHHAWGGGAPGGTVMGFAAVGSAPTYPGPTILTARDVPISVTWSNALGTAPHLLHRNTEPSFLIEASACYPNCGVPTAIHIHGLENPPKYDGLPTHTFYHNSSFHARYANRQNAATKVYHDHAWGLAPLNTWAGLVGAYIVQDAAFEARVGLHDLPDLVFLLQDKLITTDGALVYTDKLPCQPITPTKWAPESYGSVNTVNGVVMPVATVQARAVRFRWINAANARAYTLALPFASKCRVVATDSGFVQRPSAVPDTAWQLFPLERVEMVCDFTHDAPGTTYDVVDTPFQSSAYTYDPRLLRIRIVASETTPPPPFQWPTSLVALKDLRALHVATGGTTRTIGLGETMDMAGCSTHLFLEEAGKIKDIATIKSTLHCTAGKVEKWRFHNPTADPHPFHWHLVNAQCGPSETAINTNELKDVVAVPPRAQGDISYVCFVACTPDRFLTVGSTRAATDFGFNATDEPYLAHCHIMEHEENQMMAWFRLTETDVQN